MGLHQTKELLNSKETVTRLQRQTTEEEKTFAIYSSNKGLISRIYRVLKMNQHSNEEIGTRIRGNSQRGTNVQ
jgi:hypothetical protein